MKCRKSNNLMIKNGFYISFFTHHTPLSQQYVSERPQQQEGEASVTVASVSDGYYRYSTDSAVLVTTPETSRPPPA